MGLPNISCLSSRIRPFNCLRGGLKSLQTGLIDYKQALCQTYTFHWCGLLLLLPSAWQKNADGLSPIRLFSIDEVDTRPQPSLCYESNQNPNHDHQYPAVCVYLVAVVVRKTWKQMVLTKNTWICGRHRLMTLSTYYWRSLYL